MKLITKHINPATTLALAALIFAMAGGAFAASGGKHPAGHAHVAKKHKSKNVSKRGLRGKQGPAGPEGKPGPAGPAGPAGPTGATGATGATGLQGAQGLVGPEGKEGPQGDTGEAGMCSEANPECKLASGATLTGVWGTSGEGTDIVQLSFPVRVSPVPTAVVPKAFGPYHIGATLGEEIGAVFGPHPTPATEEEVEEDVEAYAKACPGSVSEPKAEAGILCIYEGTAEGTVTPAGNAPQYELRAPTESGVLMPVVVEGSKSALRGSWAVTAAE